MIILLAVIATVTGLKADEGMWMLPYIEQLNIKKMQGMGCTLSAEEIYSETNVSLKDAVIHFGGGCTGVVASDQGLIFTNHHCGYGQIQQLSAVGSNYLRDGFAARELKDELYAPNLTVRFLVSITDVTERVMNALDNEMNIKTRNKKQDSVTNLIKKEYSEGNDYIVNVRSFYSGNQFYVFVHEEFKDIRLVYTPPHAIGKFGGETDNWMWPRHTGDFAVFRVYADTNGNPAAFSTENVPYKPRRHAAISLDGVQPGDFTMIIGYPGSTSRYLTSWGIRNRTEAVNRARIDVRGVKQDVWKSFMTSNEAINIAYASKFARSANTWKNSIGMNKALQKLAVPDRKKHEERVFADWVNQEKSRRVTYGKVLETLEKTNSAIFPVLYASNFYREALVAGVEMPRIARETAKLLNLKISNDSILIRAEKLYKDFYEEVDKATFSVMLETYRKYVEPQYLPPFYQVIDRKYKGNYQRFTDDIFRKSAFSSFVKFEKKLRSGKININKDPALRFQKEVDDFLRSIITDEYNEQIDMLRNAERLFEAGLNEMNTARGNVRYPDANSTMRLTYGTVGGYQPADAVTYSHITTTLGILQKEIPGDMEFDVPANLKKAILEKDFGRFADKKTGDMVVNFLSNNDITGGNSGSPIFNGKGELLGLAFDGNWEAMSGDIVFEPELQKTINVDIRYMMFIMAISDGTERLMKELLPD